MHLPLQATVHQRPFRFFLIVILSCSLLVFLQVTRAQVLKADYQFQNTRNSSAGGSALVDTGGVNSFQTDTVDGTSRTVLRFPFNSGVKLTNALSVMPFNSYTIVMLFKLDNVSGFVRLVDFHDGVLDSGLYIDNGHLEDCQTCSPISANTYVQVVYTRNSSGTFAGYVNGVLQGTGTDSTNQLVLDTTGVLTFFRDDQQSGGEASAGSVARIRIFDAPMTATEVAELSRLPVTTLTVTNTNDSGPGSFRNAIVVANTESGTQTVNFNIPGSGVQTISPASALPAITGPVIINGTTQPGFSGTPLIELNGANAGAGVSGLFITGGASTVRGLIINRFNSQGISLANSGGNTIVGNYIGTDATGTLDLGNAQNGVLIASASSNNFVGGTTAADRNVISGNETNGVLCNASNTSSNQIRGNYIGTNAAGIAAVPNTFSGVNIIGPSTGNIVGGTAAGAGNVISGNAGRGIVIQVSANNTVVQGNLIGLAANGITRLGNTGANGFGVVISTAANNTIGGTVAGARNVISGNDVSGVAIQNSGATGNLVQGNFIGTDVSGNVGVPNNGTAGILIRLGANSNTIGGLTAGAGNRIAFNLNSGVFIQDAGSIRNAILSNQIFSNGRLGINFLLGGNNNFDFGSVSTTAASNGTSTTVQGTFAAGANTTYNVQFFSNVSCDPSGFGEGQTLLGSVNVTTNAGGTGTINQPFPTNVPTGQFVTFTATDPLNNTSRFSPCQQVNANVLITGSVKNSSNVGISGVTITLSGTQSGYTLTDASGNYSFRLTAGTYTLTPSKINLSFGPQSTTVSGSAAVNFTAATTTSGPAGKIVYVSNRFGSSEIFTMNPDGSGQTRLTNNTATEADPTWSPNGAKIAFESLAPGNVDVFTMNADGTGQTNLTNNPALDDSASWSPDGTRIAFSSDRDGNNEIYVMNTDGTGQTRLTNNPGVDEVPAWSPDGTRIAFSSTRDGNTEIYVMNADGSNLSRLTTNLAADDAPAWSPDASRIAFHSNRDGNFEIYAINGDGSNPTRLTNDVGADTFPSYSPDGTQITFGANRDPQGDSEIYVMNANGSSPTNISRIPFASDAQPTWQTQAALPPAVNIAGRLNDDSGNGLSGVGVTLSGPGDAVLTTTTDSNGNYSFANLAGGATYTVTPSSGSYLFNPLNQVFTNLTSNRIANFVGTQTLVSITGNVTDTSNVGVSNVTLSLTKNGAGAGTAQTDALGNYSFGNLQAGANYVVTPTGSFTPSSQAFTNLTTNAAANFKAAGEIPTQCNTATFAAASNFTVGARPFSAGVGDFNGDGNLDLAVANNDSANVSILLGSGTGTFSTATNFSVGFNPQSVAVGDFNGDGKLDLAVANFSSANVSILLGSGTGSFSSPTNFAVGSFPYSVAAGDFNGDSKLDLAVANFSSANVSILLGSGTGSFSTATNFAAGTNPKSIVVGDFNGDGKLDLAVGNNGSANVSILLGSGTGSFSATTTFAAGPVPESVAVGDFNGDGKLDLAVVNSGASGKVAILLGTGTGSFSAATDFAAGPVPASLAVGDFNGDGKLDLAVANQSSTNVSILLGTGVGSFIAATNFAVGSEPVSIAVGDLNGDGKLDLAAANASSASVSILLNNGSVCNTLTSLSLSGRIADSKNNPLSDVTVTLSGPITRVTQTDANGNYSFANLAPGGNYAVTAQSPYYIFAPSRTDFFNLSSSQIANFTAAPVAVPAPSPLSDDFNTANRDASKWSLGTQTQPAAAVDPQVTTTQVNGQLVITPVNQASGMHYNGYVAANAFDIRNGKVGVEVVKAASGGGDTIFAIGSDANNFFRFLIHTVGAPTSLVSSVKRANGAFGDLETTSSQLVFQVKINGQLTSLSINYDPLAHKFMRFRNETPVVSPENGAIVFETSPNNIDFTVQHKVLLDKGVSPMTAELSAGTSSPTNAGQAVFDNFSLTTSTFQFSVGSYTVAEGAGSVLVTVTRVGTVSDAGSVDYATVDGTAHQGAKYQNASGKLTFAPGEVSKTFTISLVDNTVPEGNQTVNLMLTNPVGGGFNSPGRAVLTIVDNDTEAAAQFSQANYTFSEAGGSAAVVVSRVDTSSAFTVNYATSDTAALSECNVVAGKASSRCDYATTRGTLQFAAGEGSKTIFIPLVDDVYAEGNETLTVTLSGPVGATLGTQTTATVTLQDNETVNGVNPIDSVDFFVRQNYIDFLGREPDPGGLAGWRNVLNNCGTTVAPPCDRIEVSAGFFRSEEFQSRGYFIYRFYSAVGRIPVSEDFFPDFAKLSGFLTAPQLEANKVAYVDEFMGRTEFQTKYSSTFSNPTAYVEALLTTVGLPNHPSKGGWIGTLNSANTSQNRALVLRQLVESAEVYNKYYNEAFVIMQYFGYLRRTADASYLSWINTMNQTNGDYRIMINGFMNSAEYRRRFGP